MYMSFDLFNVFNKSCGMCNNFAQCGFCDPGPNKGFCKIFAKTGSITSDTAACEKFQD